MAGDEVFEGRADLDIKPFTDALTSIEQKVTGTAGKVKQELDGIASSVTNWTTKVQGAFDGAEKRLQSLASEINAHSLTINTAAKNISGAFQQLGRQQQAAAATSTQTAQQTSAAQTKAASTAQQSARQQAAAARAQETAIRVAASRELATIKETEAKKLQALENSLAKRLAAAQKAGTQEQLAQKLDQQRAASSIEVGAKIRAEQAARDAQVRAAQSLSKARLDGDDAGAQAAAKAYQQATQAIKVAVEERAATEKRLSTVVKAEAQVREQIAQKEAAAARQAADAAKKAAQDETAAGRAASREKVDRAQREGTELRGIQQRKDADALAAIRVLREKELSELQAKYAARASTIRDAIAKEHQLEDDARRRATVSLGSASALTGAGDSAGATAARADARAAEQAAEQSAARRKSLEKDLTDATRVEAAAQTRIQVQGVKEVQQAAEAAYDRVAFAGKKGFSEFFQAFERQVTAVEDKWNSIFRAGSQLSSIGQQLTQFAQQIGQIGFALTENAGDFDFWVARTKAAMQSAGSNEAVTSIEQLRDRTLELGRELGSLDPAQLAEGWFTYQAALGTTIKTTQDLQIAQDALQVMLKAGIISDSDPATVMRGVAGVLAAYRLETDQAAYATEVLMNVTQRTQAEFGDLLEAYKMVGSQAEVMNATVAETSTLFALMAEQNIKGSQAGRSLNMVYSRLLDPTKEANQVLNEILNTTKGTGEAWKESVFAGGQFIGMLGQIDAQGNVVKEGFIEKFVKPFMELPKKIRDTSLAEALGKIFPENAVRGLLPVVTQYADALDEVGASGGAAKNKILAMYAAFQDGDEQARLFDEQWKTVSDSIKVRLDKATYGLREGLVRLGVIAADVFIPIVEWVGKVTQKFVEFAEANPQLARAIMLVVGALALIAGVVGPVLALLGFALQGIAGLAVSIVAFQAVSGLVTAAFASIGSALMGFLAPLALVGALVALFVAAWRSNWAGLGDTMAEVGAIFSTAITAIGDLLGGLFTLINGLLSGNQVQIRAGFEQMAIAIIEIFYTLPGYIIGALNTLVSNIASWASSAFGSLSNGFNAWGYNLMMSFGNGIIEAANYVYSAVEGIAEGISSYFRSYSPPRYGPLKGIYIWGRNLIKTFVEGMNAADITAVSDIAGRIGDALKLSNDFGDSPIDVKGLSLSANELAARMVGVLQEGGRVGQEFFAAFADGLGIWYDDITNILSAYQDVYLVQKQLDAEQKRLDLIKKQREELQKQNDLRQDAFDGALDSSSDAGYDANQQYAVDPTTDAGKAQIEAMRASLSTEEFQNWINFQKRLWDQKTKAEDQTLSVQEEAANVAVDALNQQLELVKAQYDYYVRMYEYAKGLLELAKEDEAEKGGGGGGAGKKDKPSGDLEAARAEARKIAGDDAAIYDETQLAEQRGGDTIGAHTAAGEQQEREQERIADLDAENRKRRAKLETDLVNAKSDEEKARLKAEFDAWDAAYKEEKARLQERLSLTKDINEAADKQADGAEYARELEMEKAAQEEIAQLLGDQTGEIKDAAAIKAESGDLDKAAITAKEQLREEERKLKDLQALGDQKRLDYQRRIREAGNDPEKVRRIKEEQEAWEAAYKQAVEAQQARVEAARRTSQDITTEVQEAKAEEAKKGPKGAAGGGYGVPKAGDFSPGDLAAAGGGAGAGGGSEGSATGYGGQYNPDLAGRKDEQAGVAGQSEPRASQQDAKGVIGQIKEFLTALKDVEKAKEIFAQLGQTIGTALGSIVSVIPGAKQAISDLTTAAGNLWSRFKDSGAAQLAAKAVQDLWAAITGGNGIIPGIIALFQGVISALFTGENASKSWSGIWNNTLLPALQLVWNFITTGVMPALGELAAFIVGAASIAISGLAQLWTGTLQPALALVFDFVNTAVMPVFWTVVDFINGVFTVAVLALQAVWETKLKPALEVVYAFMNDVLLPFFGVLVELGLAVLETAVKGLTAAWELMKPGIEAIYIWLHDNILPIFTEIYNYIKDSLLSAIDDAAGGFDEFKASLERVTKPIKDFLTFIKDAIAAYREWLGMSSQAGPSAPTGGGSEGSAAGSYAKGLYAVPYDEFPAILHKGERVLTAAEAEAYNSAEGEGLVGVLTRSGRAVSKALTGAQSLVAGATGRAAQAVGSRVSNVSNTNSRTTNVTTGDVYASDPTAGKAFLNQIAFLGADN